MTSIITSKALEALAEYVIVLTNAFTKFTFPVPTGYQPSSTVVKTLVCDWFLVYGVHNHIHSDQGSCVAAEVMRGLCGTCGAKKSRKWVMLPHSPWSAMHLSFWQKATLSLCIPCDAPYLYRVLCLLPIMFGIDPKLDNVIHLFLIMSERTNQAPVVNGFPYTRTVCPVFTSNLRTSFKKRLVSANSSLTAPNQHPYWWESLDS